MLTKREIEVLELVKKGMKQADIAEKLKISQPSISAFKNKAYNKLKDARKLIEVCEQIGIDIEESKY